MNNKLICAVFVVVVVVFVGLRNSYDRDYIGFATLPEQVHRKSVKRGFDFTLLVAGETGLGKSTLINSLFLGDLYKNRVIPSVAERLERTTQIEKKQMEIEERGVKLRLTIVDTPGFGDSINSEESWRTVISYIDEQVKRTRSFLSSSSSYSPNCILISFLWSFFSTANSLQTKVD